jgi:hypothetical protein
VARPDAHVWTARVVASLVLLVAPCSFSCRPRGVAGEGERASRWRGGSSGTTAALGRSAAAASNADVIERRVSRDESGVYHPKPGSAQLPVWVIGG